MVQTPNKYPVYIVSKGRWAKPLTARSLDRMGISYRMVIEPAEHDAYAQTINPARLLHLPKRYQDTYEVCDDRGQTKVGPGAARNFCWDHSIEQGYEKHWVLDDNIARFFRLHRNRKTPCQAGAIFRAAEDFIDRYENVPVSGFQYGFFAVADDPRPAFILNTRIYSCLLIQNDLPMRWRGRYNEDTDLSLRVLKAGLVTLQFNAFLQDKQVTQSMSGGNMDLFYREEGTEPKSRMLCDLHPDVSTMVWKYNRWHHYVDYRPFKRNRLKRKPDAIIPRDSINEYGMILIDRNPCQWCLF